MQSKCYSCKRIENCSHHKKYKEIEKEVRNYTNYIINKNQTSYQFLEPIDDFSDCTTGNYKINGDLQIEYVTKYCELYKEKKLCPHCEEEIE